MRFAGYPQPNNTQTGEVTFTSLMYQELALSLLVLRVFTDYSDASLSLNDFALFTNWFY